MGRASATGTDPSREGGEQPWEIVLAASVVATVPVVLLFLGAQRYVVDGIATTGSR